MSHTTCHHACECRERNFKDIENERDQLRSALRVLAGALKDIIGSSRDGGSIVIDRDALEAAEVRAVL